MSLDKSSNSGPPPWLVLCLVSDYFSPESLAIDSCASKNWLESFSSDDIWELLCSSRFSSVFNIPRTDSTVSYCHLYAIAEKVVKLWPPKIPVKPRLALDDILFIVTTRTNIGSPLFTMSKPCNEIRFDVNGSFQFAIPLKCGFPLTKEVLGEMRITCDLVLKGWKAILNMMESCEGSVSVVPAIEGVFSKELPLPRSCPSFMVSNIVTDVKLGLANDENEGKVNVGIFNKQELRYLSVDNDLRCLQEFLLS